MIAAIAAVTLAVAAHAAPAVPSFEQSLIQIHDAVRAANLSLITAEQLKKVDKNVSIVANQAAQLRSRLASLRAQANTQRNDPGVSGQLYNLTSDLNTWANNCGIVKQQTADLAKTAEKDPTLKAAAQSFYDHSRYLDSNAGYLAIDSRSAYGELAGEGYGNEGYRIMSIVGDGASQTPDVRLGAKSVLDKIGG
jgi:hypothetical protein